MTLADLATAHGVATSYDDYADRRVEVSREAVVAALAALGVDASTDDAVAAALERTLLWQQGPPPVVVVRAGQPGSVEVVAPRSPVLQVELEAGGHADAGVPVALERRGDLTSWRVDLPDLPLGYHRLGSCVVIVAPQRITLPEGRHWGWQVQLYALRSAQSWGVGDYADLRTVVESAAADGAGVVLVNPLHAELPVLPLQPSPYSPSSRLFRSALGLRIEDIPEAAGLSFERPPVDPERIDRDTAWTAKLAALEQLWPRHRVGALAEFRAERGRTLEDFALFCALAELHGVPWQQWPADLHRPSEALHLAHQERISFWCWVQLLVDEQLASIGAGMAIGVVHDLAVGVDAGGADAWALQDVLALGTTVGAPPDLLAQKGQNWGLPPWRPDRLREQAYAPFRAMVQGVLRHAGGLRVDHVMGLSRLWWVPAGATADHGTYVSYDADALLGILALEATRAGAVVIGEDLGTVEPRVGELLDSSGVLGSSVLWFETAKDGTFLPPAQWRRDALGTVTTHDLPTAAGMLAGENVRLRAELNQLGVPLEQEQARAKGERDALIAMLQEQGLVGEDGELVLAMHRALVASPCRIVLAAYGDAVGDLRQPNLPGTVNEYPNWRLPVADATGRPMGLEELLASPGVRHLTTVLQHVR